MTIPAPLSSEKKHKTPFLIVDKKGLIGALIAERVSKEQLVILVSRESDLDNPNIIHVPFKREIPVIPDNTYSDILFVDDGSSVGRDAVPTFISKARKDNSTFIFFTTLLHAVPSLIETIKSFDNSKIIIAGEIFDDELVYDSSFTPTKFVETIRQEERIRLEGDGMRLTFPVLLRDVVEETMQIISSNNENKIFCLYPKYPLTHLSLAHTFQKINPLIKIDFVKEKTKDAAKVGLTEGIFPLGENISLENKIKSLNLTKREKERKIYEDPKVSYFFRKLALSVLFFALFIIILPLSTTLLYAKLGVNQLNSIKSELETGRLADAKKSTDQAQSFFNIAFASSQILIQEASLLGQGGKASDLNNQISVGLSVSQAASYLVDATLDAQKISTGSSNSQSLFSDASNSLKNSIAIFRQIQTNKAAPSYLTDEIQTLNPIIDLFSGSIDQLPEILGFSGKRTYLVLFQNNMELRPSGGFIGSYAVMTLKNARIIDFKIYDVYDADGQLKEHVEPPFAIRRYLPSPNFYLRDSNFYIDFPQSAQSAENFLRLEKNNKFDGVFAVDVRFVSNVLSAIGGVNVPNYNTKVTGDNIFELSERYSQKNFFPGSTQKKDFLSSVFRSMQDYLSSQKGIPYLSLARVIGNGLNQKNLLVYFNDQQIQNVSLLDDFSSSILDQRKAQAGAVNDYLGINEANLGVNKVNYYISRSVSQNLTIDSSGKISSRVTIAYKNGSDKDDYKNYMRVILPLNTSLSAVLVNGVRQNLVDAITNPGIYESKSFKPPAGLEVEKTIEDGKNIYGFLLSVPKNSLKTVTLEYLLRDNLNIGAKPAFYNLRFLKQPGTDEYPFSFSLSYPKTANFVDSNQKLDNKNNYLFYTSQVDRDFDLNIEMAQK